MDKFKQEIMNVQNGGKYKHQFYIFSSSENLGACSIFVDKMRSNYKQTRYVKPQDLFVEFYTDESILYIVMTDSKELTQLHSKKYFEKFQPAMIGQNPNLCIFISDSVDGRSAVSKAYSEQIVKFDKFTRDVCLKYIQKETENKLSRSVAELLIDYCDSDYARILFELDNIKNYHDMCCIQQVQNLPIRETSNVRTDINKNSGAQTLETSAKKYMRYNNVSAKLSEFEVCEKLLGVPQICFQPEASRQKQKYFYGFFSMRNSVLPLFIDTLIVLNKILLYDGTQAKEIADYYGLHPYRVQKLQALEKYWSNDMVRNMLAKLYWIDTILKTGLIEEYQVNTLITVEVIKVCFD